MNQLPVNFSTPINQDQRRIYGSNAYYVEQMKRKLEKQQDVILSLRERCNALSAELVVTQNRLKDERSHVDIAESMMLGLTFPWLLIAEQVFMLITDKRWDVNDDGLQAVEALVRVGEHSEERFEKIFVELESLPEFQHGGWRQKEEYIRVIQHPRVRAIDERIQRRHFAEEVDKELNGP